MRLSVVRPAPDLAGFVAGYCLIDDPAGALDARLLRAAPQTGACLCLQLGDDVDTDFRDRRPRLSYAGIQPHVRIYRPAGKARSVVILLSALGSITFLPSCGRMLFGEGVDAGALLGDGAVWRLRDAASAADNETEVVGTIDAWLRLRFAQRAVRASDRRLASAMTMLSGGSFGIDTVAARLELSPRQLERNFIEHLGAPPKTFQQIVRVAASVQATLSGDRDPLDGYADQAHQIRSWRTFLGVTPGQMKSAGPSEMATKFLAESRKLPAEWAHYL
ncbi:MAG: helix-turn-helix transcriptional regulator [Rhizobiaceae bacterium]|nr:helix-turn-helix transcriptional regulator [Rhizobiaceae bacterium]